MMLIGKTANWLIRHSVQRIAETCEFLRMREIT